MSNKVYEAINNVSNELLAGIKKDSVNQHQRFNFRGIDAVYNALAPALVKHKLVILPRMTERTVEERASARGGALFYVTVRAEFDFVSSEDGSKHTVTTYGEAMDSGDKATNKAMSIAYKYAAFQAFCIPTEETSIDPDAEVHEVQAKDQAIDFIADMQSSESLEQLQAVFAKAWSECRSKDAKDILKAEYDKLKAQYAE